MNSLLNRFLCALSNTSPELQSYAWFINMTCTEWNYKLNDNWRVPYEIFNGSDMRKTYPDGSQARNWTAWIYFEGDIWSADKIGNINLAYVGIKMGFSTGILIDNFVTRDDEGDGRSLDLGIRLALQGK